MKKKAVYLIALILTTANAFSQIETVAFSYGMGYCGTKSKLSSMGSFGSVGIPFGRSEVRLEVDNFTFPQGTILNDLHLTTLEIDYMYRGSDAFAESGGFTSIGVGLSYNFLNGGCEKLTTKNHNGVDSMYYSPIDHKTAIGIPLYMGGGIYIFPKISIYAEYTAKIVFYNTYKEATGEEGFVWGGWRLALRFQPFKF